MQVVHHEGQRLHNELENVSYNTPNLNSEFSGRVIFTPPRLERGVLLIQFGVWNWVICNGKRDFLGPQTNLSATFYLYNNQTVSIWAKHEQKKKNWNSFCLVHSCDFSIKSTLAANVTASLLPCGAIRSDSSDSKMLLVFTVTKVSQWQKEISTDTEDEEKKNIHWIR